MKLLKDAFYIICLLVFAELLFFALVSVAVFLRDMIYPHPIQLVHFLHGVHHCSYNRYFKGKICRK